ncbi:MAG: tetratricopeptide repeat protein [Candidatus Acidiferrales bacterium]
MTTLVDTETISASTGAGPATRQPAPKPSAPWIYGPWLDLLVGCGAWSAPLLAVAMWMAPTHTHAWVVAFYALALVFNYPHFMATIYRAYHTRENFEKYKFFTLHITLLLALTVILMHASPRLFPWVFTLYICWSPWHYSGQNYGLLMMFARRSGAEVRPMERRWLRAAFIASYLMLLASFETGGSTDPLILSLGLPAKFTFMLRLALGAAFAVFTSLGFQRMVRKHGIREMIAPITLAITQFLWFVLPTLLELRSAYQIPQTRYSSGILAVLHSTQYIWITSYYQRREARASGQSNWRMPIYFLTLLAGGIALFIPGPWLVSYIFHFDFTTSFLIFMAVVNIHHFILDGRLWKLRDNRVASLLVDPVAKSASVAQTHSTAKKASGKKAAAEKQSGRRIVAPAFAIGVAVLLFLWGGMDQIHFALSNNDGDLSSLQRAADMNPYDSALNARIALAEAKVGNRDEAVAALAQAVDLNPASIGLRQSYARALIEANRYGDAYALYQNTLKTFPRDVNSLVNFGLLAARLGNPDQAIDSWQKAVDLNPNETNAHLYLAHAFDQRGEPATAARHWETFLRLAASQAQDSRVTTRDQIISATIQLADDESVIHRPDSALTRYQSAIILAQNANNPKLESLALAHLADLQEKKNDASAAAQSYQRSLALDAKAGDALAEGFDWFNYGQFLRRHQLPKDLAYACFLRAEDLLANANPTQLETVHAARRQLESEMGRKSPLAAQKDLPALLARATNLPAGSL